MKELYEPKFVEKLFDKMSSSYSKVNYITSFGFSERWRRQCVEGASIEKGKVVVDLMTGMGECWKHILNKGDEHPILIGLDFSSEMIKRAEKKRIKLGKGHIKILKENVFNNSIDSNSADCVVSGFGLKTFNDAQLKKLADEVDRILKPNGRFSLIDVSVPKNPFLKPLYMFYLRYMIPLFGRILLGNPQAYKMLGVYTHEFGNAKSVYQIFERNNFEVEYVEYFFGCASGIRGSKIKRT